MRQPSLEKLREETAREGAHASSFAQNMHPNPRWYKYYWWVFWSGSPSEGPDFRTPAHRLATRDAFELRERLWTQGESYWLYNQQLPRLDPGNSPFNPQAKKWEGVEWAPAFDQDTDPEYRGHK